MQLEWQESFLGSLVLIYSTVLIFIMDMAFIESRFSKRIYLIIATLGMLLSCGALIILNQIGGLLMLKHYGVYFVTIPSFILFYVLSKHRGNQFFLAYCTADIAGISMMMISISVSFYLKDNLFSTLIIWTLLLTLMIIYIVKWVAKPFSKIINEVEKGWGIATLITFQLYLFLHSHFIIHELNGYRFKFFLFGALILSLVFSIYRLIYKAILKHDENCLVENEEQQLRLQLAIQKEQFGFLQKKIDMDKMFRHDLRHHTKLILELIHNDNIEGAENYLQRISGYALEASIKNYCENMMVNAVLSVQLAVAKQRGINVICRVALPSKIEIDEMEICAILSNLIENAVEHCQGNEDGESMLNILIRKNKEQLCIRISNSFDGNCRQNEYGEYLSTKPHGGIGLKSVCAIIEKHNGVINITHSDKMFRVDVAL